MPRSVKEWIGKTDDTPVPPRVRLRVLEKNNYRCQGWCGGREITPRDRWTTDHIVAVINGGENRESNLQSLCDWCVKKKDAADVAAKSMTATLQKKTFGIKKRSRFATAKTGRWKVRLTSDGPRIVERASWQHDDCEGET